MLNIGNKDRLTRLSSSGLTEKYALSAFACKEQNNERVTKRLRTQVSLKTTYSFSLIEYRRQCKMSVNQLGKSNSGVTREGRRTAPGDTLQGVTPDLKLFFSCLNLERTLNKRRDGKTGVVR